MMRSRSTPVVPNAFPMCSDVLSLDAYRSQMRFLRGQMWPARPAWPAWLARPAWPACLARLACLVLGLVGLPSQTWRAWPAWSFYINPTEGMSAGCTVLKRDFF